MKKCESYQQYEHLQAKDSQLSQLYQWFHYLLKQEHFSMCVMNVLSCVSLHVVQSLCVV